MNKPIRWLIFIGLIITCIIILLLGILLGSKPLSPFVFLQYLEHAASEHETLIFHHRIPRTLTAFLCGSALGLAGALMQGLTRNPLGDPGLLGINAGASAAIVAAVFFPSFIISDVWLAFMGALIVAFIICILGMNDKSHQLTRLILVGAAISASLFAFTQAVSQWYPAIFDQYRFWSSGSFSAITINSLLLIAPIIIIASFIAIIMGKYLNMLSLGYESAQSLGINIIYVQIIILLLVAILAGLTVAVAGPISFIGLGAAHIARSMIGSDYRLVLPASCLLGALLLTIADIIARIIVAPSEISTGIVTSMIGAPLLFYLIMTRKKVAR